MKPIYGTTLEGTYLILDIWLKDEQKAIKELMLHISINRPETEFNTDWMARGTIEKWIEDNF